jgi:hypothetical protein
MNDSEYRIKEINHYPIIHPETNRTDNRYRVVENNGKYLRDTYLLYFCDEYQHTFDSLACAIRAAEVMRDNGHSLAAGVSQLTLESFTRLYLDFFNDFFTVERFAEYHELSLKDAQFIVDTGRAINSRQMAKVIY